MITAILVLGLTGLAFSLLLSFLSKKLKVEENPKVEEILNILPGLNCGACGFSGCRAYGVAVVKENKLFSGCLPGGVELTEKIENVLGLKGGEALDVKKAVCRCGASSQEKKQSSIYNGPAACKAADITGGAIDCIWGCLGFGDCISACPVGAISLLDKKIYIDIKKCIGCGICLKNCPRNLFEIVPLKENVNICYVACNNQEKALDVRKACAKGCIGCGICVRVDNSPYYIKENLSYVDYSKATNISLEKGKAKCPTKCIAHSA
ncbi:MAG: RnfABCDGE type electron transport complex subunit B [Candidatus Omnitrophota bacterium]